MVGNYLFETFDIVKGFQQDHFLSGSLFNFVFCRKRTSQWQDILSKGVRQFAYTGDIKIIVCAKKRSRFRR